MAIEIRKRFDVEQPVEAVWDFLVTPSRVVSCLPGARLLEVLDDRTFRGELGLHVGPFGTTFVGTIHFDVLDRENHRVAMSGQGRDASGTGSVQMSMKSALAPRDGGGTHVEVLQSVSLSGGLLSFGRGALVRGAAEVVFSRFTSCVQRTLASSR